MAQQYLYRLRQTAICSTIYNGEVKILQMESEVDRVAVGNGDLLSTSLLDNGQLLLLAEGEGETNVHIWYSNGRERDIKVQIEPKDSNRVITELKTLLADLKGVDVRQVGERFFSPARSKAEKPILDTVINDYEGVMNLTRISAPAPQILPRDKMIYMDVRITEFSTNKLEDLGIDWSNPIAGPSAGLVANAEQNRDFSVALSNSDAPSFAGALAP
ncbi:MAG: pilus assembly protein N-terminal domain-containing protein [Gammaproteobacteria bacterium]|nr:pilus assembly protein N-terminal domain-containing protein [Gammaproteobacteria bacterium]